MYLYFNENGILKEIINDSALRKGNVNANVIYAYFEGSPEISTLTFSITRNGETEPIVLNQDSDSPLADQQIPYDSTRKLKYFQYYTDYTLYKCTLTAETLAIAGLWQMTIQATNYDNEIVAMGMYQGIVEDNNISVDTTITYGEKAQLQELIGTKANQSELANYYTKTEADNTFYSQTYIQTYYQEKLVAGEHISISDSNEIDVVNVESTITYVNLDGDLPDSATQGTITEEQLATLQSEYMNFIVFKNERYYLNDDEHEDGYLTYSHVGYENNAHMIKSITITISTLSWVLNETDIGGMEDDITENTGDITSLEGRVDDIEPEVVYSETDITDILNLGITRTSAQLLSGRMIQTSHQLIFDIKAIGTANAIPQEMLLSEGISINATLGARLKRYNTTLVSSTNEPSTVEQQRIGSGIFNIYYNGSYYTEQVWAISDSTNTLKLYSPIIGETSLTANAISLEIRIVIDLL